MVIISLILFGLVFGSFINALVYRLSLTDPEIPKSKKHRPKKKLTDEELSISKGRSVCTDCGHQLAYQDLVPVLSWVSLRGKCRYCEKSISWQYPAVELATAGLFVVSWLYWPYDVSSAVNWAQFCLWLLIVCSCVAMSVYDMRWLLIPDKVLRPTFVVAVAFVLISVLTAENQTSELQSHILSLLIIGGGFLGLYYGSGGRWIGGGDVKLSFLMSFYLGMPAIFVALAVGFYGATLIILPLLALKRISRKQQIPFGPFLLAGFLAATLFSEQFIDLYFDIFSL